MVLHVDEFNRIIYRHEMLLSDVPNGFLELSPFHVYSSGFILASLWPLSCDCFTCKVLQTFNGKCPVFPNSSFIAW